MPKAAVNGIEMQYIIEGKGPALVFIHGLGSSLEAWRPHIPFFVDQWQVIAADTRGHGESSKPPGPYSIELFARDWHALLDDLGIEKTVLLGLSMGGAISMQLAVLQPERIRALVLVDTWGGPDRPDFEFARLMEERIALAQTKGMRAYAEAAVQSAFSEGYRKSNPQAIQEFIEARVNLPIEPVIAATRACVAFNLLNRLHEIQAPTLVLVGSEDILTPPSLSKAIVERIPHAVYREIPGSGHVLPVEKPEEFRAAVAEFLENVATP
ncbi:MAG: alpha/beta fold hydrolase [candidate division NC10 bacterium]|nr:alpha/beta fold hydrolase [candidate division NC10 bacterium]